MTCVHGSAAPFLDAAVQSVANNGMLMVTCTDMATLSGPNQDVRAAVLSSSSPCGVRSRAAAQACFGRYGCVGIRGVYHHELAVRMLLSALRQCAARYGRHVQPLLSLSVDFYVRRRQGTLRSGSAPQDLPRGAMLSTQFLFPRQRPLSNARRTPDSRVCAREDAEGGGAAGSAGDGDGDAGAVLHSYARTSVHWQE